MLDLSLGSFKDRSVGSEYQILTEIGLNIQSCEYSSY